VSAEEALIHGFHLEDRLFEGEAVLHVIERIVAPLGFGSTQRHLGWTRDLRTALGCRPTLLAPLFLPTREA
jgi:hypothetical protein